MCNPSEIRRSQVRFWATAQIMRLVRGACTPSQSGHIVARARKILRAETTDTRMTTQRLRLQVGDNCYVLMSALHELSRTCFDVPDLNERKYRRVNAALREGLHWTGDGDLVGGKRTKPLRRMTRAEQIHSFWVKYQKSERTQRPVTYVRKAKLPETESRPKSAIRFAVIACPPHEVSSDSWIARADPKGGIYVATRTNLCGLKASLHQSGRAHVKTSPSDRMGTWTFRIRTAGSLANPALKLYFPLWGLSIRNSERRANDSLWAKNATLVVGTLSPLMTSVSFVPIPRSTSVNMAHSGMERLGQFRAGPNADVVVVTEREESGGLYRKVTELMKNDVLLDGRPMRMSLCHPSRGLLPTHRLVVQGPLSPEGEYLVALAVTMSTPGR